MTLGWAALAWGEQVDGMKLLENLQDLLPEVSKLTDGSALKRCKTSFMMRVPRRGTFIHSAPHTPSCAALACYWDISPAGAVFLVFADMIYSRWLKDCVKASAVFWSFRIWFTAVYAIIRPFPPTLSHTSRLLVLSCPTPKSIRVWAWDGR